MLHDVAVHVAAYVAGYVAKCCGVLRCSGSGLSFAMIVAVCCSVLVAGCCMVLHHVAVSCVAAMCMPFQKSLFISLPLSLSPIITGIGPVIINI